MAESNKNTSNKTANKTSDKSTTKKAAPKKLSEQDRLDLNNKARYDYGIMNAEDMQEAQLKQEMAAVDKQLADAQAADAKAAKEAQANGETQNVTDTAGKN